MSSGMAVVVGKGDGELVRRREDPVFWRPSQSSLHWRGGGCVVGRGEEGGDETGVGRGGNGGARG